MSDGCDTCRVQDLSDASPGYRKALMVVIALNLGMGAVEVAGGIVGTSQALKADALDFLGDGFITLLGLVALGRSPRWRSKAAFLQGAFLAALAVGVIGAAVFRALVQRMPSAEVMGGLGVAALVTNVTAALLLVRYRHGDASVRAVWLFSRNDALGNVAVIVAAALVTWTGTVWPDLVAALGIAGLFLSSAVEILKNARAEMRAKHHAVEGRQHDIDALQ
ncbi:MAG: cobalt transporter [Planctomycetota bacterium]